MTWEIASTQTHNNKMVKWAGGRQHNKRTAGVTARRKGQTIHDKWVQKRGNARYLGGVQHDERRGVEDTTQGDWIANDTTRWVDRQRRWLAASGSGGGQWSIVLAKGDNKGGQEQHVSASELAGCSLWGQRRMAKFEAVRGGKGILPSFFMIMCGC